MELDGGVSAAEDRVQIYDAQKPIGHWWGDLRVGYRLDFGSLSVKPYGNLQYTKTNDDVGSTSDDNFFLGGGAELNWALSDALVIWAEYSYLNNANRPSVAFDQDIWGEHQLFVGLELNFLGS